MKKFKEIFYVILILYLLLSIILILSSDRLNDRYGLLQINKFMFVWLAIGVLTMCTGFVFQILNQRRISKRNTYLESELARIKIKHYDSEEVKERAEKLKGSTDPQNHEKDHRQDI